MTVAMAFWILNKQHLIVNFTVTFIPEPTQQKLPKRMSDWTIEHVKCWLLDIGVPDSVAEQLFEEEIDGKTLETYTRETLMEDFEMKKGKVRLILDRKEKWLQSEKQYSPTKRPTKHKQLKTDDEQDDQQSQSPLMVVKVPYKPPAETSSLSGRPKTPTIQDQSTLLEHQTSQSIGQIPTDRHDRTVQLPKEERHKPPTYNTGVNPQPSVRPKTQISPAKYIQKKAASVPLESKPLLHVDQDIADRTVPFS